MVRFADWTLRLERFLAASELRPFQYGIFDCCLFACDGILAMTGTDVAAPYREQYTTRAGAMRLAKQLAGARSVRAIAESVTAAHGMDRITPLMAHRGDVVLIQRPKDYSMGIVAMNGFEVLIAMKAGYGRVPLGQACAAWRV